MEVRWELVAWELMKGHWQQTTSAGPPTEKHASIYLRSPASRFAIKYWYQRIISRPLTAGSFSSPVILSGQDLKEKTMERGGGPKHS